MIATPAASGPALLEASMKSAPEDFIVNEQLDVTFDGTGEHLWLRVRKRNLNTQDVLEAIQRCFSVQTVDIGVSGMKDRRAVTEQWLSVRTDKQAELLQAPNLSVVESARHGRKLRRGTHSANQFEIVLQQVNLLADADRDAVAARLTVIEQSGFPNYLGPQRFGRGGQNLVRAQHWFRNRRKKRPPSRPQRSLQLSAARSALFNAVCAARVEAGNWSTLLPGEPAVLAGSRSFFVAEPDDVDAQQRCSHHDIHPSGPWWGKGAVLASGECLELESAILAQFADLCKGLEAAGLTQERRALRAIPEALSHEWLGDGALKLRFTLGPGIFATMLLAELGDIQPASVASEETRQV